MQLSEIIVRLCDWSLETSNFHADRQLADEVLIADGWRVVPDEAFEGGIRWSWGISPEVSVADATRPHVINDLDAAVGVVPLGCSWHVQMYNGRAAAKVLLFKDTSISLDNQVVIFADGHSSRPSVALLIAALRFKELRRELTHGN